MAPISDLDASFVIVNDSTQPDAYAGRQVDPLPLPSPKPPVTLPAAHPSTDALYAPGQHPASYAHDWSNASTGGAIRIRGKHFIDAYGRVCNLRGVNFSGSCKTPANDDNATFPSNAKGVTFVGRPFPIEEADEHLARLRRWGLTFIRFLVTWEAIEHGGPGVYDMEYIQYVRTLLQKLPKYGMVAFVAMHQDVWSRYSGGSGAPAWTLEAVGFDLHKLEASGAAWLHGVKGGGHVEEERGIWPCGYQKLAASTMATCFWAGDTFAPQLRIKNKSGEDVGVQKYLQDAFLAAWELLASAVGDLDAVIGFETMNEPHRGYVELPSLHEFDYNTDLHLSFVPSALQSFSLGAGHPTMVSEWVRSFPMPTSKSSSSLLNPDGHVAWRPDGPTQGKCLWQMHGVWGWDTQSNKAVSLRQSYFSKNPDTGAKVDWYTDFYYPFLKTWSSLVRGVSDPSKLIFTEAIPNEFCPASWGEKENQISDMVYAPHWYDLNGLFMKAFGDFTVNVQGLSRGMFPLKAFYWGQEGARDNYSLQIANLVDASYRSLGDKPVIIGECGIPMDLNHKSAFASGDFTWQARMMDALLTALERSAIGFTLWNYNPYNTDDKGDHWNGENFSWFSSDRKSSSASSDLSQTSASLDEGGRILRSVVRPYAAKTAGVPVDFSYDLNTGSFTYSWERIETGLQETAGASKPLHRVTSRETEIFIPSMISHGRKVLVDGLGPKDSFVHDQERQTLFIVTSGDARSGSKHRVSVRMDPPLQQVFEVNTLLGDFTRRIGPLLVVLCASALYWLLQ